MLTEKVKSVTLENLYSVAKNQRLFVFSRMVLRMFMLILRETLPLTFFFSNRKTHTCIAYNLKRNTTTNQKIKMK